MVGALLAVGEGKLPLNYIRERLELGSSPAGAQGGAGAAGAQGGAGAAGAQGGAGAGKWRELGRGWK